MSAVGSLCARLQARVGELVVDVELDTGEGTLVVVGPNGAGKSTLLSLLLGILPSARARIAIGSQVIVDTEAAIACAVEERGLAWVPQHYGLFPHLSVAGNVAFALRCARAGPRDADTMALRVREALDELGVAALADRRPAELSGGERQRVALARALAVKPRALLLDEPLAALDVHARREVRAFLAERLRALAIPCVVVTHDAADVRAFGQRVLVLERGRVAQVGTVQELCARPATRFVEELVRD